MLIIERLKMELNNKEYFTDNEYIVFLEENSLDAQSTYVKETHQRNLLYTVIDILEAVSNDVDLLRKTETEFMTTESAYKHLQERIEKIKQRIYTISDNENDNMISLLFSRK
jgi:hypothetical protein